MKRTSEWRLHQFEVKEKRYRETYREYLKAQEEAWERYLVPFEHSRNAGKSFNKVVVKPQFRKHRGLVDAVETVANYRCGHEHFFWPWKQSDSMKIFQIGIDPEKYNTLEPAVQKWFYRPERTGITSEGSYHYREDYYLCKVSPNWLEVRPEKKIWYSQWIYDGKAESKYQKLRNLIRHKNWWKKIDHQLQHRKNWDRAEWKLEALEKKLKSDKYIENQEIKEALLTIHEHITPRKDPDESSEIAA